MRVRKFKVQISLLLSVIMIFSMNAVAFASEAHMSTKTSSKQFGDILYSDDGVTVFYGNPNENKVTAKTIEEQVIRGLQYDQVWINAHRSEDVMISIEASSSDPITYYTIRQETTSPLQSSYVYVIRPDGSTGFVWEMDSTTQEIKDRVVGIRENSNKAYTWTSGWLDLRWKVETGDSGARMNLWVW